MAMEGFVNDCRKDWINLQKKNIGVREKGVKSLRRVARIAVARCHSEPFDFAQDKLREESMFGTANCSQKTRFFVASLLRMTVHVGCHKEYHFGNMPYSIAYPI